MKDARKVEAICGLIDNRRRFFAISGLINRMSSAALFPAAAALGDQELDDVLLIIAKQHPLDRVRLAAYMALANAKSSPAEAVEAWAAIGPNDSLFLREWRRIKTAQLESTPNPAGV